MEKNVGGSMKLGVGGRFAKGKAELESKGMSGGRAGAVMAAAGRKKYGEAKMESMAEAGKARAQGAKDPAAKAAEVHGLFSKQPGTAQAGAESHTHPEYANMTHSHPGGMTPHGHQFGGGNGL